MDSPEAANPDSAARVPIIQVAMNNGMWWDIPREMSQGLYDKYMNNEDAGYTWDWGDTRPGSWRPDDEETSINRYVIDFVAMEQRNIDNGRKRSVRVTWVRPTDVTPRWTGQLPPRD